MSEQPVTSEHLDPSAIEGLIGYKFKRRGILLCALGAEDSEVGDSIDPEFKSCESWRMVLRTANKEFGAANTNKALVKYGRDMFNMRLDAGTNGAAMRGKSPLPKPSTSCSD